VRYVYTSGRSELTWRTSVRRTPAMSNTCSTFCPSAVLHSSLKSSMQLNPCPTPPLLKSRAFTPPFIRNTPPRRARQKGGLPVKPLRTASSVMMALLLRSAPSCTMICEARPSACAQLPADGPHAAQLWARRQWGTPPDPSGRMRRRRRRRRAALAAAASARHGHRANHTLGLCPRNPNVCGSSGVWLLRHHRKPPLTACEYAFGALAAGSGPAHGVAMPKPPSRQTAFLILNSTHTYCLPKKGCTQPYGTWEVQRRQGDWQANIHVAGGARGGTACAARCCRGPRRRRRQRARRRRRPAACGGRRAAQ
jgi:hypothetical protein